MPVYTYTTIDDPLVDDMQAFGINDEGQIVGQYTFGTNTRCFLYSGGVFTAIDDPLATDTFAGGINDSGQIVGYYRDGQGGRHGFLYDPNNPQHIFPPYFTLNDPLATNGTFARGISNTGQIVGYYTDDSGTH